MKVPKEHALRCSKCGKDMDLRDLGDVMYHEASNCLMGKKNKQVKFSTSQKLSDSVEWQDGKPIHLN